VPLSAEEIRRLSVDERLELIGQLWNSLEREALPVTVAQQHELDRRLAALDEERAGEATWESIRAEIARRCPE
jgi:putative addiction module component (TIGR02574 family)